MKLIWRATTYVILVLLQSALWLMQRLTKAGEK